MSESQKTIPVYRVENPTVPANPDGITSHEDLVGRWFSPNVDTALRYLRKSTQSSGRDAAPIDGAQLVVAHVPEEELAGMHVSLDPTAANMDVESDNYIVPRDGSIPTDIIPLDDTIGELRGQLGNFNKYREAKERVHAMLGTVAVQK